MKIPRVKRNMYLGLGLLLALCPNITQANPVQSPPSRFDPIILRAIGNPVPTVNIVGQNMYSYEGECAKASGRSRPTLVAVHGLAHTAASLADFTTEVLKNRSFRGQMICRVVTIDMPGRGSSSDPIGLKFGDLVIDDQATIIIDVLRQLKLTQVTLLGHSQGALAIEMAAERLKNYNMSLGQFGVKRVALLASSIPSNLPWSYAANPPIDALSAFLNADPVRGYFLKLDDVSFPFFFFRNLANEFAANLLPIENTIANIAVRGFNAAEPLAATLQLLRLPITLPDGSSFNLPTQVSQDTFPDGVEVIVIALSQDQFVSVPEQQGLLGTLVTLDGLVRVRFRTAASGGLGASGIIYGKKTGIIQNHAFSKAQWVFVQGTDAVHDTHVTQPVALAQVLK